MTISGNVPSHLIVGARTGFLTAVKSITMPWQQVAGTLVMDRKSVDLVDLGSAPMPLEDKDRGPLQSFVERSMTIKPQNWDITVGLSYNASQDDQTGTLETKVRGAGENFQRHINKLVFTALGVGDASTYGLCYDGNEFFDSQHVDKGASYTTVQSNTNALVLSLDNFQTVLNAARLFVDDQGETVDHNYDTLIVPPALERIGANIVGNSEDYATGNRAINPYSGAFRLLVTPYLPSGTWLITSSKESAKPIYIAMRETPGLQDAWFDPMGPDGGMYYFKFYGRYTPFFGDWRLAVMGATA
jgi:phage major head subunit gpT-like protein